VRKQMKREVIEEVSMRRSERKIFYIIANEETPSLLKRRVNGLERKREKMEQNENEKERALMMVNEKLLPSRRRQVACINAHDSILHIVVLIHRQEVTHPRR
jgi:hypothetical protein